MRRAFFVSLAAGLTATVFAADPPSSTTFAELPAAVQKGIQLQLNNGTLGQITRDVEGDGAYYAVEITRGGLTRDYTFAETGALVALEMMFQETPPAVQHTILSQTGQGQIESIEKSIDGADISYEVEWKSKDGAEHSFSVLENGQIDAVYVSLDETPPAVKAIITREVGGAPVEEISRTIEDGGPEYTVTIKLNGVGRDFSVAENGKFLSREVFLSELPGPVQQTIARVAANGKVLRIDHVFEKRGKVLDPFDVEAIIGGKPVNFSVGPKGLFLGVDP
jgi:uncharacterized membrane protein YkoI